MDAKAKKKTDLVSRPVFGMKSNGGGRDSASPTAGAAECRETKQAQHARSGHDLQLHERRHEVAGVATGGAVNQCDLSDVNRRIAEGDWIEIEEPVLIGGLVIADANQVALSDGKRVVVELHTMKTKIAL